MPLSIFTALVERHQSIHETSPERNKHWLEVARSVVEAFFHTRYFLEMAGRYERALTVAPQLLPSGWAALLYLYRLRCAAHRVLASLNAKVLVPPRCTRRDSHDAMLLAEAATLPLPLLRAVFEIADGKLQRLHRAGRRW